MKLLFSLVCRTSVFRFCILLSPFLSLVVGCSAQGSFLIPRGLATGQMYLRGIGEPSKIDALGSVEGGVVVRSCGVLSIPS